MGVSQGSDLSLSLICSYYGPECDLVCPGYERTSEGGKEYVYECSGNGICELTGNSVQCRCFSYAFGDDCANACMESFYDEEEKKELICSDHGTCDLSDANEAQCTCEPGYHGVGCSESCPGLSTVDGTVVECSSHGSCVNSSQNPDEELFMCQCSDGFFGEACDRSCPGQVEVEGVKMGCNGHGDCEEGKCVCHLGYYGEECESHCPGLLVDMDGVLRECNGHGDCDANTLQCICSSDLYKGDSCA